MQANARGETAYDLSLSSGCPAMVQLLAAQLGHALLGRLLPATTQGLEPRAWGLDLGAWSPQPGAQGLRPGAHSLEPAVAAAAADPTQQLPQRHMLEERTVTS